MLSAPIDLQKIPAHEIIEFLYGIFHRDFIKNKAYLAGNIYINPRRFRKDEDKEIDFWHLTTREVKEKEWVNGRPVWRVVDRYPDFDRASRLEWVKQILTNHDHECVKTFYHRETNKKKDIRLYLWAHADDFVVILQKLGRTSAFLVTSFYVDHQGKRDDYKSRYENYTDGDADLDGCEWF